MATVALTPRDALVYFNTLPEPIQLDTAASSGTAPLSGIALPRSSTRTLQFQIDVKTYIGGSLTVDILWYARNGATSGNVQWYTQLAAVTGGDVTSMEAKALATLQSTTTTVNANSKGLTLTTVTITNLDSIAAGDYALLRIGRGTDTLADDAVFVHGTCYFASSEDKYPAVTELTSAFTASGGATTMQTVTGLSVSLIRAGTYHLDWVLNTTVSAATTTTWALNVSANLTRMSIAHENTLTTSSSAFAMQMASVASGAAGASGFATGSRSVTTDLPVFIKGMIVVSGAATVQLLGSHSGAQTFTVSVGSGGTTAEA